MAATAVAWYDVVERQCGIIAREVGMEILKAQSPAVEATLAPFKAFAKSMPAPNWPSGPSHTPESS